MLKKLTASAVLSAALMVAALPAAADDHLDATDDVTWVVTFTVNEGQQEAMNTVMAKMVAGARTESGSKTYAWFQVGNEMHIIERYETSDDAGIHLDNFEANFAEEYGPTVSLTGMQVYGPVEGKTKERLAAFGALFFDQIGGYMDK